MKPRKYNKTLFKIAVAIEKLHRYVFDNVYVSNNKKWGGYYIYNWKHIYASKLLSVCAYLFKDYRPYVKEYGDKNKYMRYTPYNLFI